MHACMHLSVGAAVCVGHCVCPGACVDDGHGRLRYVRSVAAAASANALAASSAKQQVLSASLCPPPPGNWAGALSRAPPFPSSLLRSQMPANVKCYCTASCRASVGPGAQGQ